MKGPRLLWVLFLFELGLLALEILQNFFYTNNIASKKYSRREYEDD